MDKPAVLIIDDDPVYLESISLALDDHFLVRTVSNALDAHKIMNSADTSFLILLDLQMPGMTGVEFIERVRRENNNVPILVVTGKSNQGWARRCAELGVQGYMDKLVGIEELISEMKKLLIRR